MQYLKGEKFVLPDEKLLYQTIKELNEGAGATTNEIAHALEQSTGNCPEINKLNRMLDYLQENGLLGIDIININDESYLVWRP